MGRDATERLAALFDGFAGAYGTYNGTKRSEAKDGKLEIKSSARTLRKPVTPDLWTDHVAGKKPLGIIPIREDDTCLWA